MKQIIEIDRFKKICYSPTVRMSHRIPRPRDVCSRGTTLGPFLSLQTNKTFDQLKEWLSYLKHRPQSETSTWLYKCQRHSIYKCPRSTETGTSHECKHGLSKSLLSEFLPELKGSRYGGTKVVQIKGKLVYRGFNKSVIDIRIDVSLRPNTSITLIVTDTSPTRTPTSRSVVVSLRHVGRFTTRWMTRFEKCMNLSYTLNGFQYCDLLSTRSHTWVRHTKVVL